MADLNRRLESYNEFPVTYSSVDDTRQADRAADIEDVTNYIWLSLIDYQGKWEKSSAHDWAYRFANARYLNVGDIITNVSVIPRRVYQIAEVIEKETNTVRLSPITGSTKPTLGDRLELAQANMVTFISAYPLQHADPKTWRDTVTYKVSRREPGTVQAHPFDSKKEIKPRIRQVLPDPDYPDYHITVMGQWFDNLLQFEFWTTTANGADSLVKWFEDFLFKYTWVWKKNGVQEILYIRRGIDEEVVKWRDDLTYRSLWYFFRTEKIVPIREKDFAQIDLLVNLSNQVAVEPSGTVFASGITTINDLGFVTS